MIMIQSGEVENHFQTLVQKVEEVKVGVLAQLAKQVTMTLFSQYAHLTLSSQADVLRSRRLDRAQQLATSSYQLQPELDALQEAMVGYLEIILFVNTPVFLWCYSKLFKAGSSATRDQFSVSSCRWRKLIINLIDWW